MNEQLSDSTLTELLKVAEAARMNASRCRCRPDCDPCASTGFNQKFNHVACIALVKELIERWDNSIVDVGWAEEAMKIADVLRELSAQFNGIDNGHCTICGQHRLYDTRGNKGPCENTGCLSHRIAPILNDYEKPSGELLEQMRQNCLARTRS